MSTSPLEAAASGPQAAVCPLSNAHRANRRHIREQRPQRNIFERHIAHVADICLGRRLHSLAAHCKRKAAQWAVTSAVAACSGARGRRQSSALWYSDPPVRLERTRPVARWLSGANAFVAAWPCSSAGLATADACMTGLQSSWDGAQRQASQELVAEGVAGRDAT